MHNNTFNNLYNTDNIANIANIANSRHASFLIQENAALSETNLNYSQEDDEWYPDDIGQLMILKDTMDNHAYEIKAGFKAQLIGKAMIANNGDIKCLTEITCFDIDSEEYTPARRDDNALSASICFHVDGEAKINGKVTRFQNLSVWIDFEYLCHNSGYTISATTINL